MVERWRVARLRPQPFCALAAVHVALTALRAERHARPCKKLPGARQRLFEALDRPALRPLPVPPYADAEWKQARVTIDYPVEVDGHSDSGPYALLTPQLDVRLSAPVVALFHQGTRVASPPRSPHQGRPSTVADHMPPAHRPYAAWPPQRLGAGRRRVARRSPRGWQRCAPPARTRNKAAAPVEA